MNKLSADVRLVRIALRDPEAREAFRRVVTALKVRTRRGRLARSRLLKARLGLECIHDRLGELMDGAL